MSYLSERDIFFGLSTINNIGFLKVLAENGYDVSAIDYNGDFDHPSNMDLFIEALKIIFPNITVEDLEGSDKHHYYSAKVTLPFYNPEATQLLQDFAKEVIDGNLLFWDEDGIEYIGEQGKHSFALSHCLFPYEAVPKLLEIKTYWRDTDGYAPSNWR